MTNTADFLDSYLLLLLASECEHGKKRLPQQAVSLLLHPSFSGSTQQAFIHSVATAFCILLLNLHVSLTTWRDIWQCEVDTRLLKWVLAKAVNLSQEWWDFFSAAASIGVQETNWQTLVYFSSSPNHSPTCLPQGHNTVVSLTSNSFSVFFASPPHCAS